MYKFEWCLFEWNISTGKHGIVNRGFFHANHATMGKIMASNRALLNAQKIEGKWTLVEGCLDDPYEIDGCVFKKQVPSKSEENHKPYILLKVSI